MNIIVHLIFFNFLLTISTFPFDVPTQHHPSNSIGSSLNKWAENGPDLLWEYEGIGNGYSSVVMNEKYVFVTGEHDGIAILYAFNNSGELKWKKEYGEEWIKSYRGSRATPTIVGELIYVCSGKGDIACFNTNSGEQVWSANLIDDLNGKNNVYGYSMQLLIDGDVLYCMPGGSENNIAALNRFTAEVIWTSNGLGEDPGYGEAIIVHQNDNKILICFSEFALIGLNADKGDLLWSRELALTGDLPCNKPIYDDGYLYYVAGPGNGSAALKLTNNGRSIEEVWSNLKFDTSFGGFIKIENYLYGNIESNRVIGSINALNGVDMHLSEFKKGSLTYRDGFIYAYSESGWIGLIQPVEGRMEVLSKFRIQKGTKEHFAKPVVSDGKLYIRHGNVLMVYGI